MWHATTMVDNARQHHADMEAMWADPTYKQISDDVVRSKLKHKKALTPDEALKTIKYISEKSNCGYFSQKDNFKPLLEIYFKALKDSKYSFWNMIKKYVKKDKHYKCHIDFSELEEALYYIFWYDEFANEIGVSSGYKTFDEAIEIKKELYSSMADKVFIVQGETWNTYVKEINKSRIKNDKEPFFDKVKISVYWDIVGTMLASLTIITMIIGVVMLIITLAGAGR